MGQCGSALRKPCLSDSDIRYDNEIPKDILAQDPRWEKFQGYFKLEMFRFDPVKGTTAQPGPFNRPGSENRPFLRSNATAWYNHTFDGSRLYVHRHYLSSPAPESFCDIPSFPRGGKNHTPGGICGVNGYADVAGNYFALTHENDASVRAILNYGGYGGMNTNASYPVTKMFVTNEDTFDVTSQTPGTWSSTQSYVFYDDDTVSLSAVHNLVSRRMISTAAIGKLVRVTEEEYINGLYEDYEKFNVPTINRAIIPLESDEAIPGIYPNETDWCGGMIQDAGCTVSPYVEPDPQFTGGAIAMFVIFGVLGFSAIAYYIHKYLMGKQRKRIQLRMIRGIAQNINIASSAGQMDGDALLKEFQHMDKDKGGTISRNEMKDWLADGKLGQISDKDFNAMWVAMDTDASGEVDFVEFATYLSSCGEAFDEVFQEMKTMSKEKLLARISQRLSVKHMSKEDIEALKELRMNAGADFDKENQGETKEQ